MRKKSVYILILLCSFFLPLYISSGLAILHNEYHHGFNAAERLKVMTYNIRGARTEKGKINLPAIIDQIKSLNPDIVALQEVDYRLPRSHFQNQIKQIGDQLRMNYLFIPNINFVVGAYGNAILSKYPITDYHYFPLPSGYESRGFIRAQINTGIQTIDVFATHLGLDLHERVEQISTLTTTMSLSTAPKLLLGDFNTKPTEIPIQSLRSLYIDPIHDKQIHLPTYKNKKGEMQLDYIFYSNDFQFDHALTERSLISDHNPLLYSLVLSRSSQEK